MSNPSIHPEAEDLLAFWFAEPQRGRWFRPDPAFDQALARRFGRLQARAAAGEIDGWRGTARGALALVLLLDQLPRNLFRGTARAFDSDAAALAVSRHAVASGFDAALRQPERLFLYLPFEHSENLEDQRRAVALISMLDEDPEWLDYARRHLDVIARFGRFPHRNAALGRGTTPEEAAFLRQPGSAF